jgi:hypothetical protein
MRGSALLLLEAWGQLGKSSQKKAGSQLGVVWDCQGYQCQWTRLDWLVLKEAEV